MLVYEFISLKIKHYDHLYFFILYSKEHILHKMKNVLHAEIPQSPAQIPPIPQSRKVEESLYKKFEKFMSRQRQQHLYERLRNFYGRNYAIKYKPQFDFTEQWQGKGQVQRPIQRNLLEQNGIEYFLYSLVFMVINIASIWTMSIQRYFGTKIISQSSGIFQVLFSFTILDIVLNVYYQSKHVQSYRFTAWREIRSHLKHIVICVYLIWLTLSDTRQMIFYFIELIIIGLIYKKAADIYGCIKVTEFSLKYENQMKILDLLFNVFIQAHVFAIILFSASKLNPEKSWVQAINIGQQSALTKYIYSFYFASTTMLTIGYGDITPQCPQEIIVTVMIEIIAVVSFGYLLNEMGHTLSKMREQSEELERDLQTISKMSKYYNLERSLQNKAKAFLFSNQVKGQQLKVQDEKRVLLKLNEQLRQQIHHENSLTVVKSCVFFLCHWSKALQSQVARRLEKRLFAPNQRLVSPGATPRLFIVKHGRIDVFMTRFAGSQERMMQQRRKLLKVIASEGKPQVYDNIYGYTFAFSNRGVRLQAVAAQFTSTYSVTTDEFITAVRQNARDFEYFHEVKSRIDQSAFSQQWQAPAINNIREHFAPSKIVIIKKYRHKMETACNNRKGWIRRHKGKKHKLLLNLINKTADLQNPNSINKTIIFTARRFNESQSQLWGSEGEQQSVKQSSIDDFTSQEDSIKKSYEQALATLQTRGTTKAFDEKANKQLIAHTFESHKQFFNFFKKNNISLVLQYFEKENFLQKNIGRGISSVVNECSGTRRLTIISIPK